MRWLVCLFLVACVDLPPGVERVTVTRGQCLISAGGSSLYGADLSGLWRATATAGATPEVLVTNETVYDLIADNQLFFTQAPEDVPLVTIRRAGLDGSNVTDLATNVHPGSLRTDTANVYFLDRSRDPPSIMRVPKIGGKRTPVAEDVTTASRSELAIDNAFAFWIEGNTIRRGPKAGGASTVFVTDVTPTQLGTDGIVLYFIDLRADAQPLVAVQPTGERAEIVADVNKYWVDDVHIYYTGYSSRQKLTQWMKRIHRDSKLVERLVDDLRTVSLLQMTFDDTHLYWADGLDVRRLRKPELQE